MSESQMKVTRRFIEREMAKKSKWVIETFVKNIKSYPFKYRFKFAMQILKGTKKKK